MLFLFWEQIIRLIPFLFIPLKSLFLGKDPKRDAQTKGPVIVDDKVWIGSNSIMLSGVTIVKNAIIAAGSVVTKMFRLTISWRQPSQIYKIGHS